MMDNVKANLVKKIEFFQLENGYFKELWLTKWLSQNVQYFIQSRLVHISNR